jgi:predicted DCC family thiol-disulfide oxidoreductase YuxK
MKTADHLVFFDPECPFCVQKVREIIKHDESGSFAFASFHGKTAHEVLSGPQNLLKKTKGLVIAEHWRSTDRKFWDRSRAMLRAYWLLGGQWKLYGWLSFMPGWLGNFFYDQLSAHRHQFRLRPDAEIGPEDRFLP